jgi:hypothetical protein
MKEKKSNQFELLPGLQVRVGQFLYRIVLEKQVGDGHWGYLVTPTGNQCVSKIVALIEMHVDGDLWLPVAQGASYRQAKDRNQPDAAVCIFRSAYGKIARRVTPKDLAVSRAIESAEAGKASAFDRVTRGALKACWFGRRQMKNQTKTVNQ